MLGFLLGDTGKLFAVATVSAKGKVTEVRVYEAPSQAMGKFVGQVLMVTAFKPARCSGKPCQMDFPLEMRFSIAPL